MIYDRALVRRAFDVFRSRPFKPHSACPAIPFTSSGALPSAFAVTDLACAKHRRAGQACQRITATADGQRGAEVDRRLASSGSARSIRPVGGRSTTVWDQVAAIAFKDGWIRLHTNAPHHARRQR